MHRLKHFSPGQVITLGFASLILLGSILLMLPISVQKDVELSFIDALFISTSAVCVTGLVSVDPGDTFTIFGRTIVALLIQVGGLGVTCVGVGFIIMAGKKLGIKGRVLVKEALNLNSLQGIAVLIKSVLYVTLVFEGIGALLSFFVFVQDYSVIDAIGISIFHSIAAFNNAGFDILGGFKSLLDYQDHIYLNLVTCGLIIFGGLGFFVIKEIYKVRCFRKFSLHSKIVITMSTILLIVGTILMKLSEPSLSWLGAFFYSTTARTAGFATVPVSSFTNASLFILIIFMFIGASPGSTGGGIKTTTTFALIAGTHSIANNKHCSIFKRTLPIEIVLKAFIITFLALLLVIVSTILLCMFEPQFSFIQNLFEVTSAFGTVGLSTGITPSLHISSKVVLILTMFIGRIGPLTAASLMAFRPLPNSYYTHESITIG